MKPLNETISIRKHNIYGKHIPAGKYFVAYAHSSKKACTNQPLIMAKYIQCLLSNFFRNSPEQEMW